MSGWPRSRISVRQRAGFSLVEVVVVLAILGLLGGLVLTRGPGRSAGLEVGLAADAVAQTFRLARTRAMARNTAESVAFDSGTSTMQGRDGVRHRLPAGLSVHVTTGPAQAAGPSDAIRFFADGSSSGGRVELARRGQRRIVAVNWLTGEVSIFGESALE